MRRAALFEPTVTKETHFLFSLKFTPLGFSVYTQTCGVNGWPILYRNGVVADDEVWHFQGDIPFAVHNNSRELLTVEMFGIERGERGATARPQRSWRL